MDRDTYLDHLARDGSRLAELAGTDLTVRVPTCPDWTLLELIEHVGGVQRYMIAAAGETSGDRPGSTDTRLAGDVVPGGPADGESWGAWLQRGVDEAVRLMSGLDGAAKRWTWFAPDQSAGWYFRRIAQETLVHRIDAELAAGANVSPVDTALALDGIAEMCEVFLPSAEGQAIGGSGQTLHLHATDGEGEWLLTLHPDRVDVEGGHAKGDAALRGAARDLLLMLWGRAPLGEVEQFGDQAVVDVFTAAAKID